MAKPRHYDEERDVSHTRGTMKWEGAVIRARVFSTQRAQRTQRRRKASGFSLLPHDDGGRGENGAGLAGGEGFEGAEAGLVFGGGYAAQGREGAQKIFGGPCFLLRAAFDPAGNEIAVGIAPPAGLR